MKTASRVQKTDVKRAIEAVEAMGADVSRIEIDTMTGKIFVVVAKATARLTDGSVRTCWYAWRGGLKLPGEPGSPEFMAADNMAIAKRTAPAAGTMQVIIDEHQQSQDFLKLADRTRDDYIGKIELIEKEYGDLPLAALAEKGTRGDFLGWRDELAKSSHRRADYAWTVLARILSWALCRSCWR